MQLCCAVTHYELGLNPPAHRQGHFAAAIEQLWIRESGADDWAKASNLEFGKVRSSVRWCPLGYVCVQLFGETRKNIPTATNYMSNYSGMHRTRPPA